jgi:cytochrome b
MTRYSVWDPFIRLFHWTLVAGFAANAIFVEEESRLHETLGYVVMALIGLRLVWGLIGPRTARLSTILPRPQEVVAQISEIATGRRAVHLGHSPLGALMIWNLLVTILLIGATGYMMTTTTFWGFEWVEELHEVLVGWAVLSIVVHVVAVLFESLRTGVNLPRAMVTGVKSVPTDATLHE